MKYDISKSTAPAMPNLGKGTEFIKLLLSQVSADMKEPLAPMLFPILGAHIKETQFLYPDQSWKETCGMMAHLVAESGGNKGQLSAVADVLCRDFTLHDEEQLRRLTEWQRAVKTKGANKDKPERPDIAIWFPPADMTNPAFLQNAMALEKQGARCQYLNMSEVEMADRLCGSHRQVTQVLRNIYDRQRAGALRATADGVTGNPILRVNITISSTPFAARKFYKNDLLNGTFGRVVFSYRPRQSRNGRIPRMGRYNEEFCRKVDAGLALLDGCKGNFVIDSLNKLICNLAEDMAVLADLADDDVLWDMSKRALVSAWKAGCIMWVLNDRHWAKTMSDMVEWLVYHDLWSKMRIFADLLGDNADTTGDAKRRGPKNMLDSLPDTFSLEQLRQLRISLGKSADGKDQLRTWRNRGFITYSAQTGMYSKIIR